MSRVQLHRVVTADGVTIALHRVPPRGGTRRAPVLLVPGTFSAGTFWLGTRGQGLAQELARHGFDAWVLEPRGHGASDRPGGWLMSDWIDHDAPAAARRVLEESGAAGFHWVGHSAGGAVGAAFSASAVPAARRLRGLVLLGAPGPGGLRGRRRWLAHAARLGATLLGGGSVSGAVLGMGPDREPAPLVRQWLGWNLAGAWRDPRGGDYLAGLGRVRVPVLAVAGEGDRLLAPPAAVRDLLDRFGAEDRTLLLAGRSSGFRHDPDHAGLVIGRAAREEIWPHVIAWLAARARRPESETLEPENA